ncbi:MAG: hypothetical protein ACK5LT_08160 [Lachnospirales bacterium]
MRKKSKGFTIYESIIAIAFISICSIPLLNIFLGASEINSRARNIDIGTNIASNYIELMRGVDEEHKFLTNKMLENSTITRNEDSIVVEQYYNKEWKVVTADEVSESEEKLFKCTVNIDVGEYNNKELILSFSDKIDLATVNKGRYYVMVVKMNNFDAVTNELGDEFVNFSSSRYFVE